MPPQRRVRGGDSMRPFRRHKRRLFTPWTMLMTKTAGGRQECRMALDRLRQSYRH